MRSLKTIGFDNERGYDKALIFNHDSLTNIK